MAHECSLVRIYFPPSRGINGNTGMPLVIWAFSEESYEWMAAVITGSLWLDTRANWVIPAFICISSDNDIDYQLMQNAIQTHWGAIRQISLGINSNVVHAAFGGGNCALTALYEQKLHQQLNMYLTCLSPSRRNVVVFLSFYTRVNKGS